MEIDSSAQFVVLHGNNGAGKTNILEAVYLLSALRSFREHARHNLIRKGTSILSIEGRVRGRWEKDECFGRFPRGNGFSPLIMFPPIFVFLVFANSFYFICSESIRMVSGEPEYRRSFLDRARFVTNPSYLTTVKAYLQVLEQKKLFLSKTIQMRLFWGF